MASVRQNGVQVSVFRGVDIGAQESEEEEVVVVVGQGREKEDNAEEEEEEDVFTYRWSGIFSCRL